MQVGNGSRIFEKGLEILELIAKTPDGITINALKESLKLHRTSVYRYLKVLLNMGYVEKKDTKYVLGPKALELASLYLCRLDVRRIAHPHLVQLAEKLQVTVHLAQLAGPEAIYIDKVETHHSLPLYSRVGRKVPLHCTALGKALLAFSSPERREILLGQLELKPCTNRTITDPKRLLLELEEVRQKGYAVDRGEHEEGISCIAAPVFDLTGEVVAALSATDLSRKILNNEGVYSKEVQRTAQTISRALGWTKGGGIGRKSEGKE